MNATLMKQVFVGAAFVAAGVLAMAVPARAEEALYVAPAGNDAWSGTLSEANAAHSDGPLATLDQARRVVRARIAKGPTSPITVQIRGGEYELDKTVVFGPEDSGTLKCPITYCAYPGEKPVFTGGKRLTDWKPCTNDPEGLPPAAKGKLWTCDIPVELKGSWRITTLYDGLTMLPRAHSEDLKVAPTRIKDDNNAQPNGLRDTWRVGDIGLQHDWEMYDKGNAVLRFRQAED